MERFAVIGSNSFSGASFVARLLEEDAEIIGISRSPEPDRVFLPYKWICHDRFSFHQLDLNHHIDRIMEVLDAFKPDYVVNFAAQGMVDQSWECPRDWFITNTVSMVNLHDELRKRDYLRKFVQASTPEVYGSTNGVIKEDCPYNPSTPYAVSKTACDMSLMSFQKAYGFPVVLTRAANVCGPAQRLYRIIPRTILGILTGQKLSLQGGGASVRCFIHIRDVVDGMLRAARAGVPGDVYHLSTDSPATIRSVVELICSRMGVSFSDSVDVVTDRLCQDCAYLLDFVKARRDLGWVPSVSLEQAIDETIDWVKSNLAVLREQPLAYIHKK